jgi:hypothetical protein
VEHQDDVAGGDQDEVGQRPLHGGQDAPQRADALAQALDRHAGVDQLLGGLERDQIPERVAVVPAGASERGADQIGLRPIPELPE